MRWIVLGVAVLVGCATGAPQQNVSRDQFQAHLGAGEWAKAYVLAATLVCSAPSYDDARTLVQLWDRVGRPSRPSSRLETCEIPPDVSAYVDALTLAVLEQYPDAIAAVRSAQSSLAYTPENQLNLAELRYREGVIAALAGLHADAAVALDDASGLNPERVDIRLAHAAARLETDGPAASIETLRGVLTLRPSAREVDRARELLNRAVERSQPPLDPTTRVEVASALSEIEKDQATPDTALRLRTQVTSASHPKLKTAAGLVMMKLGRLAEGSFYLVEAAEQSPLDPEPSRSLGTTLYAAGQLSRALPHLRDAVARDPFDRGTLLTLAEASAAADDIESAARAYERLIVLEPLEPDNYLWIARMARRRGDLPSARRAALRGCELVRSNIPLFLERASIEAQIALSASNPVEREEATARTRDAVDALLDIAPGHPGAQPILDSLALID